MGNSIHPLWRKSTIGLNAKLSFQTRGSKKAHSYSRHHDRNHSFSPGAHDASKTIRYDTVTASLASIPQRRRSLQTVVERILPQVDKLNVYLNDYPNVPSFLQHPKITVARSQDHGNFGDCGKFFWCEQVHGYHFTLDDDLFYPHNYVDTLIARLEKYNRQAVVSAHGDVLCEPFISFNQSHIIYPFCDAVREDTWVHILGTGCLAYHTDTFCLSAKDFKTPNLANLWLALTRQRAKCSFADYETPTQLARAITRNANQINTPPYFARRFRDYPHHQTDGNLADRYVFSCRIPAPR